MQINKLKKLSAVTLAEALIALSIIGFITALTLPSLKVDADKMKIEGLFKKAYYELNQAFDVQLATSDALKVTRFKWDEFSQNLNIARTCINGDEENGVASTNSKCMADSYRSMDGSTTTAVNDDDSFVITSGISFKALDCNGDTCKVLVDLNGPDDPNVYGYDAFEFIIDQNGVEGNSDESKNIIENNWKITYW